MSEACLAISLYASHLGVYDKKLLYLGRKVVPFKCSLIGLETPCVAFVQVPRYKLTARQVQNESGHGQELRCNL